MKNGQYFIELLRVSCNFCWCSLHDGILTMWFTSKARDFNNLKN